MSLGTALIVNVRTLASEIGQHASISFPLDPPVGVSIKTIGMIYPSVQNSPANIVFQRFDINGDGVLDEAEKVVGRRIMTEMFLDNHQHDIHLYGQGLSQKVMCWKGRGY